MKDVLLTLCVAILGGAFSGFLPFWITRKDARKLELSKIIEKLTAIEERIKDNELQEARRNAELRRIRILQFYSEMCRKVHHTKDEWDQACYDITEYKIYCQGDPGFKNDKTESTIRLVLDEYAVRLRTNDFV